MFDLSELFESLWPEPAAIDFAAWSMVGVFAAALWLALKMLKRGYILINPLLLLSLVSLGLPGIIRLFLQDQSDSNSGQLLRFLDLFPELTTNILILGSTAELLISRLDLPRYIGLSLEGITFCLISSVLSTLPHLTWEQLSESTTITLWADGLVVRHSYIGRDRHPEPDRAQSQLQPAVIHGSDRGNLHCGKPDQLATGSKVFSCSD